MTGFRLSRAGMLGLEDKPESSARDVLTFGKVIGGGLPVGAFGGRAEIMAMLAPDGPVYQAGPLSGNPIATAAGLATLQGFAPGCDRDHGRRSGVGSVDRRRGAAPIAARRESVLGVLCRRRGTQ